MAIRDSSTLHLILSTSKCFRYVFQLSASFYQHSNIPVTFFGDEMHSSSLKIGRKRIELNVCESFKYFPQELLRKYLKEKIFIISKVQFHHEGGLSKSCYFELFYQLAKKPHHTKNQLSLRPPSCFFKLLA